MAIVQNQRIVGNQIIAEQPDPIEPTHDGAVSGGYSAAKRVDADAGGIGTDDACTGLQRQLALGADGGATVTTDDFTVADRRTRG
ncbi:hypothetical protein D3C81_2007880 [compost metagenome]